MTSAAVAYQIAFWLSFPLCGIAAYELAYELTSRRDAAIAAGLAFMLAPYRIGQMQHLEVLAYYGAPAALAALHRYKRTGSTSDLAYFAGAWVIQALWSADALVQMTILLALWILWFARSWRLALTIVAVWAAVSLPLLGWLLYGTWPLYEGYRIVHDLGDLRQHSADLVDFLSASDRVWIWGSLLPTSIDAPLFPGLTLLTVAAVSAGVWWRANAARRAPRGRDERALTYISLAAIAMGLVAVRFGSVSVGGVVVFSARRALLLAVAARALAIGRSAPARRAWQAHSTIGFYLVVVVMGYVLAVGPYLSVLGRTLLYQTPYSWMLHIPGVDHLPAPARFAAMATLGQAVLLAFALARVSALKRWAMLPVVVSLGLVLDGWPRPGGADAAGANRTAEGLMDAAGVVSMSADAGH